MKQYKEPEYNIIWPKDRVFPQFRYPKELFVVDLRGTDFFNDYRHLVLTSLQGLVSRELPRIYIIYTDLDEDWLKTLKKYTEINIHYVSIDDILEKFSNYARGYIVYDPELPDTVNIATTMAGLYNCVVVHPKDISWVEKYGIKKIYDFRGKLKSRYKAYLWAYENLWPKCDHRLLVPMCPGPPIEQRIMQVAVRDYVVALKLFVHYLDPKDPMERDLFIKLLRDMPPNTAVLGWYGEDELLTVHLASCYNKFVVVMTHHYGPLSFPNPTVWSGITVSPEPKFKLPPIRGNLLGGKKIYITFYVTDGDNLQFDYSLKKFWDDPNRGKIPIAWTISPFLVDVAPFIAWYYTSTATENDTFVSGPSGAGYWYPSSNSNYTETQLEVTKRYFLRTGLKFTEILGYNDGDAAKYMEALDLIAIKMEYNELRWEYFEIHDYICARYLTKYPIPVIFGVYHYRGKHANTLLDKIVALKDLDKRPVFALVISQPWDFDVGGLAKLKEIVDKLANIDNITIINFHEFSMLLNPKYGYEVVNKLLGKIESPENQKRAREELSIAEDLVKKHLWEEAALHINNAFQYIDITSEGRN